MYTPLVPYKKSRMKQKYFFNLYLICSILGITPFYSFKQSKLIMQYLNKTWLIILVMYRSLLITGYFIIRFPEFEKEYSLVTIKVLEHPAHFSYWVMPFSVALILLVYNCKIWEGFLIKFNYINEVLPLHRKPSKWRYAKRVLNLLLNVMLFVYMALNTDYCKFHETIICTGWQTMYNFEELAWLYMNIITNEIVLNIKDRYDALNHRLMKIMTRSAENRFMTKDVVFLTVKQLKKIKLLHRDVTDLLETSSFLLGWPIFCLMTYTLLDVLSILNGLMVGGDIEWVGTDSIELLIVIIYNIQVALSCDVATCEGRKIIKLCYNEEENFPIKSPIHDELMELAEQAKYFTPKFISMGLFNINKRILLSMVTTITTYVIIIIQFNSK